MIESITSSNMNYPTQETPNNKPNSSWQSFRELMKGVANTYAKENRIDPATVQEVETAQYDKMDEDEQSLFQGYVCDKIDTVRLWGMEAAKAYDYKEFKRRQITFPPVDAPSSVKKAWKNTLAKHPQEAGRIQRYIKYTLLGFHGKELLQSNSCYDFINKQMDSLSKSHQENGADVSFFLGFFKDFMQELEKEGYKGEPNNKDTKQP